MVIVIHKSYAEVKASQHMCIFIARPRLSSFCSVATNLIRPANFPVNISKVCLESRSGFLISRVFIAAASRDVGSFRPERPLIFCRMVAQNEDASYRDDLPSPRVHFVRRPCDNVLEAPFRWLSEISQLSDAAGRLLVPDMSCRCAVVYLVHPFTEHPSLFPSKSEELATVTDAFLFQELKGPTQTLAIGFSAHMEAEMLDLIYVLGSKFGDANPVFRR